MVKGPSCNSKCFLLIQLLALVLFTVFSHCPAKATHASINPCQKNHWDLLRKRSLENSVTALIISPQTFLQLVLAESHLGQSRLQTICLTQAFTSKQATRISAL